LIHFSATTDEWFSAFRGDAWRRSFCAPEAVSFRPIGWLAAALALLGSIVAPILAQQPVDRRKEYNVKAAYVYSFGRYVTWPEESFVVTEDRFVIGVVGESPLTGVLRRIAQVRKINGRQIELVEFASLGELRPCQILFVSRTVVQEFLEQSASLDTSGMLVVGESPGFADRAGAINFYLDFQSVRFEINPQASSQRGVQMGAKLLTLGRPIEAD